MVHASLLAGPRPHTGQWGNELQPGPAQPRIAWKDSDDSLPQSCLGSESGLKEARMRVEGARSQPHLVPAYAAQTVYPTWLRGLVVLIVLRVKASGC